LLSLILNAVRLALGAIVRNKTRAALTVLGILIGIAAVVTVTALAGAASDQVGGQIDSFAANAIYVAPQTVQASGARSKVTGRLTEADGRAVSRDAVSIAGVAPWLSTMGQVVYMDRNAQTVLIGTNLAYFPVRKWTIAKGENWTESDEVLKTKVCLIGATVQKELFGTEDPIGRIIRIGYAPYRVIGVLGARGSSMFGEDQDDRVMMPIGSFRARVMHTSPGRTDQLIAGATSAETVDRAIAQVKGILRQRHHIQEGQDSDFTVESQAEFREAEQGIADVLSALLLGVAAVSLLVGGIGVMNIMLVSVAERTREIGIRMSIGARARDILTQFLVEAIVLTMIGGLLGIGIGIAATLGLGHALDWPVTPSVKALLVAVATSATIGVAFGYLPARRAAMLDPIEALRVE
jgi:putative ABC transport system permease protein